MNDVAMCFAALEVIAKEAPAKAGKGEEMLTRLRAVSGDSSEETAIRLEAAELLEAVQARPKAA